MLWLQCGAQARAVPQHLWGHAAHPALHLTLLAPLVPRPAVPVLQEQYAGIAKAISQFEPLKMIASPGAVSTIVCPCILCRR